jgi:hypothetical protein
LSEDVFGERLPRRDELGVIALLNFSKTAIALLDRGQGHGGFTSSTMAIASACECERCSEWRRTLPAGRMDPLCSCL